MKTLVIYHRADQDGIFSREICRRHFGDQADYLGWDYGDQVPLVENDRPVVMVDISVDGLMGHPNLVWIDHHKSAIEKFSSDIPGYRIDGVAACRLAWQWFNFAFGPNAAGTREGESMYLPSRQDYVDRTVSEPYAVRMVGEYDIWDKRDPLVDVFQDGLKGVDLTNHWGQLFSMNRRPTFEEVEGLAQIGHTSILETDGTMKPAICFSILDAGRVLGFSNQQASESLMRDCSFELLFEGLRFLAVNKPRGNSRTFASAVQPQHDALLTFYWARHKWRISLYHVPHRTDIDLSLIATKFGGGGHRGACGFECRGDLPFWPNTDKGLFDWAATHVGNVDFHVNVPPDVLCTNPWIATGPELRRALTKAREEFAATEEKIP